MILTTILVLAVALVAYLKREDISIGSGLLGFVLAFLLLGTFAGPHLQDFMAYIGTGAEDAIAALWHDATTTG